MNTSPIHPDVTPIRPAFTHTDECDLIAIGRFVRHLRDSWGEDAPVLLRSLTPDDSHRGKCECRQFRLNYLENSLRLARKAFKAHLTDEHADRVTELTAQVEALRGVSR